MSMNQKEQLVIKGIISRLRGEYRQADDITAALETLKNYGYLETWLVGPLHMLLEAQKEDSPKWQRADDLRTAVSMSR